MAAGTLTSSRLVGECLDRISDPDGEGGRVFLQVDRDRALAEAAHVDALRARGVCLGPWAGIPVSVKDLFDIAGQVTRAGSLVLADDPPASRDALAVTRLRQAGMVVVGRTNMTEFAYSGLGINPHYGTPRNPFGRTADGGGRIPGGSSSGAAVSVTDGMALAGLGSDTGGSCRIPAALCGIVGYKPTADAVPGMGALPLSSALDSFGTLARTVECCAIMHDILAGGDGLVPDALALAHLRLLVPTTLVLDDLDAPVAAAFQSALSRLTQAGAAISEKAVPLLGELAHINALGGFTAAEAWAWHRHLLAERDAAYDPRVSSRIRKGAQQSAADFIDLMAARQDFIARFQAVMAPFDLMIMPTTPMTAPTIAETAGDDASYARINLAMLRNSTVINFADGCAISIPIHPAGDAPIGLTIAGPHGADAWVLAAARAMAAVLR